jgi:hypothetical protein
MRQAPSFTAICFQLVIALLAPTARVFADFDPCSDLRGSYAGGGRDQFGESVERLTCVAGVDSTNGTSSEKTLTGSANGAGKTKQVLARRSRNSIKRKRGVNSKALPQAYFQGIPPDHRDPATSALDQRSAALELLPKRGPPALVGP